MLKLCLKPLAAKAKCRNKQVAREEFLRKRFVILTSFPTQAISNGKMSEPVHTCLQKKKKKKRMPLTYPVSDRYEGLKISSVRYKTE